MSDLVKQLSDILRPDQVDDEGVDPYRYDRSGWRPAGRPAAVVFPETVDDVRRVLRLADSLPVPVVTRGAGTGLSGAAIAVDGELVVSTLRLNRIVELSPTDELAVVEPGVIPADLDAAASEYGLRYAPDPASVGISTIGGNIATNAGGLRCAKYGVTRDSVLGLDVVLADGTLLRTGRRTVKGVTGYDMTGLFVGSEGTLGVVVAAALRLRPLPVTTATVAAYFATVADAASASAAITAHHVQPALAELLDGATLGAIDAAEGTDHAARGGALLLVQTDGAGAFAEAEAVAAAVRPYATAAVVTADPAEADELLRIRRLALPSLERQGRVLIEDAAVPRSRLAEAVTAIGAIADRHGVRVATFAHAGDGNLHPIFVLDDGGSDEIPENVWAAAGEVFTTALRLGGTLTGEHGIGLLKRRWLADELGSANLALQHRLKDVFDPRGILNPGKAL